MRNIQLDTDLEGPLVLNDNAFELCREFIRPDGDRFFKQVSRYDDYLADMAKTPGYKTGDTLKFILPFLKASGLTNENILDFSRKTLRLVSGVEKTYSFLHRQGFPIYAISASYRQFAEPVAKKLGFQTDHIFSTDLNLDKYAISPAEAEELRRLKEELTGAPDIELPPEAASLKDLAEPVQETLALCHRIFYEKVPAMDVGRIYREVNVVGGPEKVEALNESLARTGISMADTIYVGDSITDVQAFQTVRAGGGLSISFNGNHYAVKAAEVVVAANSAWPVALLACVFRQWGKDGVLEMAAPEMPDKPRTLVLPDAVIEPIARGLHGRVFNLYLSNNPDRARIIRESEAMRVQLRGAAVAELG
jgi:predicted HAD superfamily phosphohydrolase